MILELRLCEGLSMSDNRLFFALQTRLTSLVNDFICQPVSCCHSTFDIHIPENDKRKPFHSRQILALNAFDILFASVNEQGPSLNGPVQPILHRGRGASIQPGTLLPYAYFTRTLFVEHYQAAQRTSIKRRCPT